MALTSTNDADTIKSCQNNALSELKLIIHHQHLDIELASPVYFCNRGTYNEYPVKRTDDGTIMNISLIPDQDKLDGMMVYKVQRNGNTRSDQSSINTIYAKVVEEASKMMQFFITWKIRRDTFKVNIILVEYGNDSVLSEDKLAQLYNKIVDMPIDHGFCVLISGICFYSADTVLMYDNTALNIVYEIARKEGFGLKITISEGDKDEYTMRPMWIDPESLTLQSTVDMIVDNRCTNIKLTSPIYFIKDAACPIQFPQQVNSESTMKVSFKTDIDQATFGGALLYHLQKREDESGDWSDTDEDESISIKLLVIWGCKSDCFYSRAYIILHESTFTWNEEKLKMLYNLYNSQYQLCTKTGEWWLHVDLMLKTKCKRRHAGLEIVVSISEEYLKYPREPLWFDSNSFLFQDVFYVLIYNQCSNFELVSPVYFGHNATWTMSPDQKVDVNTKTKAIFERDTVESEFTGVLMYKLQRKGRFESTEDNTNDTSTSVQLLIICETGGWSGLSIYALLIEHNNTITWNEDKLRELHSKHLDLPNKHYLIKRKYASEEYIHIEYKWQLDDTITLVTKSWWGSDNCKFEIILADATRGDDFMTPLQIPSNI